MTGPAHVRTSRNNQALRQSLQLRGNLSGLHPLKD
jgi:hypothetical protein